LNIGETDMILPHVARTVCLALAIPALAGCGGGPPKIEGTAVRGKVVYKGKGKVAQLAQGKVRLRTNADPNLVIVGIIEEDGTFTIGASAPGKSAGGVPAGQYKARIEPPLDDEGRPRRVVHPRYMDFDKSGLTVTVPPPGEVTLVVDRT
jgi:hypothetical protein